MSASHVYLNTYLAPLAPWLEAPEVTDILVNRPGEVWVERLGGGLERQDAPALSEVMLSRLAQQVAAVSHQGVSREHPLLAATLPDGSRVQIVLPPATRAHPALAIRKHVVEDRTLEAYDAEGAFGNVRTDGGSGAAEIDAALRRRLAEGDVRGFLAEAVRVGRNIVISGGTSTGKTTFLNALLKEIPQGERVIAIEDTPEVRLPGSNAVGLVAVHNDLGEAQVGVDELLRAALRMRPDRLLVGEIRGTEAFTFLRAINTGHAGSLTTVHADSAAGAIEQIAMMTLEAGLSFARADIIAYARDVVDVVVQLARVRGRRLVSEIAFLR